VCLPDCLTDACLPACLPACLLQEEEPPPPTPEWEKPLLTGKIPIEWIDCDVWDGAIDGEVEDPVIHLADTNFYSDPIVSLAVA